MNQNDNKPSTSYKEQQFKIPNLSSQTLYCVLSYIYIFWLIGLLADKENKQVRFHVNQGIILSIVLFSSLFVINILSNVLYYIAPVLASLSALLQVLWLVLAIVFISIGINNALKNRLKPLPFIGLLFNFLK